MKVGFIGLGIMGGNMAWNARKAGYDISVYNRSAARVKPFTEAGVKSYASPAELAKNVDVVVSCVTNSADVEQIALGEDGIIAGALPGLDYIDCSTISPSVSKAIAEKMKAASINMLEAPLTGGEKGAREATLTIMVGGDKALFDKYMPLFQAVGKRIVYVGESGQGEMLKLVLNMVGGATMAAAAEGIIMAQKAGLDPAATKEVLMNSTAYSRSLEILFDRLEQNNYKPGFSVANRYKDFALVMDAARDLKMPVPVASAATSVYEMVRAIGESELDQSAVLHAFSEMARLVKRD
jgi:3-hydroxyisobutyrate dehydrogenase-like beta-hydroxyacid dehydrogenase